MRITKDSLAQALFLETQQQELLTVAVNNGICMALNGDE
ncbi:DUF6890 family protein [Pseudoalteromonas luteoviolacea]